VISQESCTTSVDKDSNLLTPIIVREIVTSLRIRNLKAQNKSLVAFVKRAWVLQCDIQLNRQLLYKAAKGCDSPATLIGEAPRAKLLGREFVLNTKAASKALDKVTTLCHF